MFRHEESFGVFFFLPALFQEEKKEVFDGQPAQCSMQQQGGDE
jgi:hypothetical protein